MKKRRFWKTAGILSTQVVVVVGFAPSIFKIPAIFHPWLLIATIIWIVVFSSGVFSL